MEIMSTSQHIPDSIKKLFDPPTPRKVLIARKCVTCGSTLQHTRCRCILGQRASNAGTPYGYHKAKDHWYCENNCDRYYD